jgi:NADP-dependent 3-hydroxy acid dehydrogenase YdfG
MTDERARAAAGQRLKGIAISPDAVARAILFALTQPPDVDVGSIVIRPTAQD